MSPIRLAIHLSLAFVILAVALRLAIQAVAPSRPAPPWPLGWALASVVFVQVLLGALTAGVDAGAAFADWPTIGGAWLPDWTGAPLLDNPAALQFLHRTAGYAVLLLALATAWRAPAPLRSVALLAGALALAQAALGVAVVMTGAHLALSLVHQAGAVALWLAAVALTSGRKLW